MDGNVQKLINYVLNSCNTKLPIKFTDFSEIVSKDGKLLNIYLPEVKTTLQNVYGIIMVDVPDSKSGKRFICYAEEPANSPFEYDAEQQNELLLLFLVLSHMFMTSSHPTESEIEKYLNALKINFENDSNFFNLNVKKLITDTFVKQMYLKKTKIMSEYDTDEKYSYAWGFRSEMEFSKMKVLQTVAKILDTPPDIYATHYKQALEQSNNMHS